MSVGGIVEDVEIDGDRVWVLTRRAAYLADSGKWVPRDPHPCAIFVALDSRSALIEPGDKLWWQGRRAMWTPKAGGQSGIVLRRIGCSGVTRPSIVRLASGGKEAKP